MKRQKHSLSHYVLLTGNMGRLLPVACFEVLPGDSVQQSTSLLLRVSPLISPVMHPVSVRVHHWFVPHRLVWSGWEDFITGGADGQGGDAGAFPTMVVTPGKDKLSDYLGLPTGATHTVSALPFRSYNLIWNEFYRDQDLVVEVPPDTDELRGIAWEKDYFTSARPWPQKGPDVSMPLGVNAPVIATGDGKPLFNWPGGPLNSAALSTAAGQAYAKPFGMGNATGSQEATWADPKLIADLTNATAVNVNDVRLAFALQRYQEARARYGSRYTEYLRYLGVRSSDARLQRPEYLGGGKQTISFSEVLQTGPGSTPGSPVPGGVGQLAGHGISAMRSRRYRRFFEEHGLVISLLSVRPRTMYAESAHKMFWRRTKEEYWQKELETIGQQEIITKEVYAAPGTGDPNAVFGYQDRYADYKHIQSRISGEFRDTLNFWHMARSFADHPTLNGAFVQCDATKRIHAEQTQHSLWIMCNNSIQARRMVSRNPASRVM